MVVQDARETVQRPLDARAVVAPEAVELVADVLDVPLGDQVVRLDLATGVEHQRLVGVEVDLLEPLGVLQGEALHGRGQRVEHGVEGVDVVPGRRGERRHGTPAEYTCKPTGSARGRCPRKTP